MDWVVIENLLFAMIRSGTPLLLCGMGVVIAERAGVLNLGQEGMMLMGAVVAFIVGFNTESMFLGVLCGMASGVLSSLLFAVLSLTLQANQVAAGLALSIFGTGLAAFVGAEYVGQSVSGLGAIEIPLLSDIPLIGRALFAQDALIYLSLGMFVLIWFALNRWRMGLTIRAVGENPDVAHKLGIRVIRVRYLAVMAGGAMAGLAGAFLALSYTPLWSEGISAGRGWIALALVVFASWRLARLMVGAYLFGLASILNLIMQGFGWSVPPSLLAMTPYVITILVLVLLNARGDARQLLAPRSLGQIYRPEN